MYFNDADIHSLHRIVYFSRAVINAADEMTDMMQSILSVAVPRNAKADVSGALLACDKWFVQVLEGDRLSVGEIYQMIRSDRRHRDTTVITAGPIVERSFAGWSMCGQTLCATDDAIIDILQNKKLFDPATLTVDATLRLLLMVKNLQARDRSEIMI